MDIVSSPAPPVYDPDQTHMQTPDPLRLVSPDEVAVIRAALRLLPKDQREAQETDLDHLQIEWTCYCGCDTVTFVHRNPKLPYREIAEGVGTNADGEQVGVVIWGNDEQVTRLEICDGGSDDAAWTLPRPASIRPWPEDLERFRGRH